MTSCWKACEGHPPGSKFSFWNGESKSVLRLQQIVWVKAHFPFELSRSAPNSPPFPHPSLATPRRPRPLKPAAFASAEGLHSPFWNGSLVAHHSSSSGPRCRAPYCRAVPPRASAPRRAPFGSREAAQTPRRRPRRPRPTGHGSARRVTDRPAGSRIGPPGHGPPVTAIRGVEAAAH